MMERLVDRELLEEGETAEIGDGVLSLQNIALDELRPYQAKALDRRDQVGLQDELGEGGMRGVG